MTSGLKLYCVVEVPLLGVCGYNSYSTITSLAIDKQVKNLSKLRLNSVWIILSC